MLEQRSNGDEWEVERATTIASHYAAAGDQPAALRATVRAALAARDVHAYGEAADLAERALELWPRVPDPQALVPLDRVELLTLAATGHSIAGTGRAARSCCRALWASCPSTATLGAVPVCWRGCRGSSGR